MKYESGVGANDKVGSHGPFIPSAEQRQNALDFVGEWRKETREHAEAKAFWIDFFSIFGIQRRRVATFEQPITKNNGKRGYIDLFWPRVLLVEHKSRGEDLGKAREQAKRYLQTLPDTILPRYLILCDFHQFHLEDLDNETTVEFSIEKLPDRLGHFGFLVGQESTFSEAQEPITVEAVEILDRLHNDLAEAGYTGHNLEVFLVRILYCLFAEDTGIFAKDQFHHLIQNYTRDDGSDTGSLLHQLFQVLDTPAEERSTNLPGHLDFSYINGSLFSERIDAPYFTAAMRKKLLDCTAMDWSYISPAIFGSLFQGIMGKQQRRQCGAHYTSEKNILKVIEPLFVEDLWAEFEKCKANPAKLRNFHKKLSKLRFLDPACGCGNFLVVSYREIRVLELEVLQELSRSGQLLLDAADAALVNVDQFYGIEIEEFPAQIARVALWLTDHLENRKLERIFGKAYARIPLITSPKIVQGNALQLDWNKVLPQEKCYAVMGNPPFVGKNYRTPQQDSDMAAVAGHLPKWRSIDYVANWHIKAISYIQGTKIVVGFVSTNSICQGEQVSALWPYLLENGLKINFAHQTFAWQNEAKGRAGVHCVILGFSVANGRQKYLWSYDSPSSEPRKKAAKNIAPYLIDAPSVIVHPETHPLCRGVFEMVAGSKPTDAGHYMFTPEEKEEFLRSEPNASKFFRRCIGADEFINGIERWTLWLAGADPAELRKMPHVMKRIEAVHDFRAASSKTATRNDAARAAEWQEIRHNGRPYIVVPSVSSENRLYVPMGFVDGDTISTNLNLSVPDGGLYQFGILQSTMHMAWMRLVAGRLKSDYRYAAVQVYNTFPWPQGVAEKRKAAVEQCAQDVLGKRQKFPGSTLADLYDPLTMPAELHSAHAQLDRAVDLCYRTQPFDSEDGRVGFLLVVYEKMTQK